MIPKLRGAQQAKKFILPINSVSKHALHCDTLGITNHLQSNPMPVTISANGLSMIHKGSGGKASATLPDLCLTQAGPMVVPVPYPNSAKSSDLSKGSKTVTADGGNSIAIKGCNFSKSKGDAAGDKKGMVSGSIEGKAEFITSSPTVKIEGKGTCRLSDKMTMNSLNTMCLGGAQNPSVSVTEDMEGTYTVDLYYTDAKDQPVYKADFKLIDSLGNEHIGELDEEGEASVTKLPPGEISVFYGESKKELSPNSVPVPNRNYLELPSDDDLLIFAKNGLIAFWDEIEMPSDYSAWTWGAIMGDFNQDRGAGQISFDAFLTAFPYIDQAADARDLTANLYSFYNADDTRDENDKYIDLVITFVGFIPTVGSLIKGLFKELHILKKAASLDSIAAFLRGQATGDVVKWLQSLKMSSIKTDIYKQLENGTEQSKKLLTFIEKQSRLRGFTVLADAYKKCISQLDYFFKKVNEPISRVLSDFDYILKMILPEAPLVTSCISFNIASDTSQAGKSISLQKERKATKQKAEKKCPLCKKNIGKDKKECEGAKVGSLKKANFERKNSPSQWVQLEKKNTWIPKSAKDCRPSWFHPLYHSRRNKERPSLAAHHLIPVEAFDMKIKKEKRRVTSSTLSIRRIAHMCAYDVNHPNNAVVLPSLNRIACFYKIPKHCGPHAWGNWSYTNVCLFLTNNLIADYIKERPETCSKIKNSDLLLKFDEASVDILDNIATFEWLITSDGKDFDGNMTPYVGCKNNGTSEICTTAHFKKKIRPSKGYKLSVGK